jgi:NAD-dependent SIR2 family protein deacetylase
VIESRSPEHLIDLILSQNKGLPNYALFLGAGASWYSGIKTADEMVEIWRNRLYLQSKIKMKYLDWLTKQDWYNSDEEYSYLFEHLYDESLQRRDFIEKLMEGSHLSWGYVYLANLLREQIFNAVFTTNFDDLINEACYLYTDGVRPIVCAHDSGAMNIRLTTARPKIIKLHGDFLFDSILKNTETETKRLTRNMKAKFAQFGQECGLVVVGYGGRDASVMDILEKLLAKKQFFKHGIYWCLRGGDKPRARVARLLEKDRVHPIDIIGFDELMAMIHDKTGLNLPPTIANPMKVAEERSRIFCSVPGVLLENKIIRKDIERVLDGLGKVTKKVGGKVVPPDEMPRKLKVAIMKRKGDFEGACEYMKLEVAENKNDSQCAFDYAEMLAKLGKTDLLKEFIPTSSIEGMNKTYFLLFVGDDKEVIKKATSVLRSDEPGSLVARINRAIAYKRLGMTDKMNKDLDEIEDAIKTSGFVELYIPGLSAGVAALRKKKKTMLRRLKKVLEQGYLSTEIIKLYPVFEDYHNDADFKSLIAGEKKKRK